MNEHSSHVLLIEDNPGDADLIRLRLVEANSDVSVSCANRLSDGLASLHDHPPAVVLLDLNLPDSHGAETFRNVLSKAPGVPVVVLSGQDDEELAVKAVHQGVQDYLVKGNFDSRQLGRTIRYAVERQALLTSLDISRKQQLQFKDEFLSHVSHELRTPLTCIHQFVTLMLDGIAGGISGEQREHLTTVLKSVNQLRNMIGDLLEATRAESRKLRMDTRCVSLSSVARQAVSMLQTTAREKGVGLEMAVDSRVPLVHADPDRVMQVLVNLVDNAIKFTPANGSVMVKACMVEADPAFVYVSVADTGRGISPEARALVFERMYQDPNSTDNSRKGLGLGLYIARELIRLHGGRIWVESQPGHGSVFTFTIPVLSLKQLLLPIVTTQNQLREDFTLIRVAIAPVPGTNPGVWADVRSRCVDILQRCIYPDRDVLLPPLAQSAVRDNFVIVASANATGGSILATRLRRQLEDCHEIASQAAFSVTSIPVSFAANRDASLPDQVQSLADHINKTVMADMDDSGRNDSLKQQTNANSHQS